MLALFLLIASSYFSLIHPANAGIQYVRYSAPLQCYHENSTALWLTQVEGRQNATAMCQFPAHIQRNSIYYNYSVSNIGNEVKNFSDSLIIEFNDTITRFSADEPLKYVIESDGIVRSQLFIGYHAKQLIENRYDCIDQDNPFGWDPCPKYACDSNGGYRDTTIASIYLVVYPNSLSEHSVNDIQTNLTDVNGNAWTPAMKDPKTFFSTTLNSSGMICFGEDYSYFITSNVTLN